MKKLTRKEKERRREIKKKLQADGILPPDKPRLDRRRFRSEVCRAWDECGYSHDVGPFLNIALGAMVPKAGDKCRVTDEELGILKLMKVVMECKKCVEKHRGDEKRLTVAQLYEEAIRPVVIL